MKTYKLFITGSLLVGGLLFSSCDNKLDVQPRNSLDSKDALKTQTDLQALLVGAYDALGDGDLYGGNLQRNAELLGDNGEATWDGTFIDPGQIYRKQILVTNQDVANMWISAYSTINICNTVLANLDLATDANEKTRIEGEAKFIRGSMYFELVRLFAKSWGDGDANTNPGVPLVLTPTTTISNSDFVSRSTVAQVYAQVIKDLTDAEAKIPISNDFYASSGAAAAMLSRVYLQQSNYAAAANAANRVIQSNQYKLVDLGDVFDLRFFVNGRDTEETILSMQVTDQDGVNNLNLYYIDEGWGGRGDIYIENRHLSQYETADNRGGLFYQDDAGLIRTAKFVNKYGNIQVLRLAEMYLTRAEANFQNGSSIGATPLADINLIRSRAGLGALTSAQLNLNAILKERRLELAFEGTQIHDIKRTRRSIGNIRYNADRLVYPIPQREILANKSLIQNSGY
ncbi:RagB/SusD family nutrient uptake outer membrane protein [Arsenicibacter rosenii]|uniref:RagB/SusD family nutrient uptake outer membrane protein n=1 Tax=Arsenicibacter rosenii TaxID=1750698 RepID=A0A1S2VKN1_9BACT|nr:RagB/SusD family nutrient uptake outer membrane protein [Arsenicibacter rosenii]OIN59309.1 RagB/SusD family nutrient uptake outer membrane protein [Arsenicibacter rosenii]